MVLGCDGIWELMNEKQVISFVDKRMADRRITPKELEPLVESLLDNLIAEDTRGNSNC
jgi:serine/threonine protein phosphatase PrpC